MASPALTWTLCEVVEAAVPGLDAVLVAVASRVHSVHPPVRGETAQVPAVAAFPWATSRHQKVLGQREDSQQNAGKLHRGSHPRGHHAEACGLTWDWVLDLKCVLSPRSYFLLLMTRRGLNTSSVQAGQDYTLPQGPLWPGIPVSVSCVRPPSPFPFRNRSAEQPKEQNAPFLPRSDKHDFHIVPCLSLSPCVFTSEHLPPVHCAREETGGKGGVSLHCFASHILPLSLAFLTCVQLVYPFPLSPALSLKNSTSSALFCQPCPAALCHPTAWNESEECDHLAGLQAIVPGGPVEFSAERS